MTDPLDALDYHELTKHSVHSVQTSRHFLDWDNQPTPFKIYSTLDALPLPRDFAAAAPGALPDLRALARLLHYSAGITRTRTYPSGDKHSFRACACTGALYHIDLYAVCGDIDGLAAGVYHFGPHDFALRRLRAGDHRATVVAASGGEPALAGGALAIVCTSTFWRNAWKYQSRTYRHCFWDCGTLLANLLAVAATADLPARIAVDFADAPVNALLGLDGEREVAIACVAIGSDPHPPPAAPPAAPLSYPTAPLSQHEISYPAIVAAHAGSSLRSGADARAWRERVFRRSPPAPTGPLLPLATALPDAAPRTVEEGIAHRGSARRFAHTSITDRDLAWILRRATADVAADFHPDSPPRDAEAALLNDLYLIVNAVDGLAPGSYVYHPVEQALELLSAGDFRGAAGHLDLGQELAADASVNFYALSDLDQVVGRLGNRGYRAAALEAAVIGGRIYLAAYRLRLGATGLTFYDDDVTAFFAPHAASKDVMFLVAVGHPRPQA